MAAVSCVCASIASCGRVDTEGATRSPPVIMDAAVDVDAADGADVALCPAVAFSTSCIGCAPDWSTAVSQPPPIGAPLSRVLVQCGSYRAVCVEGADWVDIVYYGDSGYPVGAQHETNLMWHSCTSYDPSFSAPSWETCIPLDGGCPLYTGGCCTLAANGGG